MHQIKRTYKDEHRSNKNILQTKELRFKEPIMFARAELISSSSWSCRSSSCCLRAGSSTCSVATTTSCCVCSVSKPWPGADSALFSGFPSSLVPDFSEAEELSAITEELTTIAPNPTFFYQSTIKSIQKHAIFFGTNQEVWASHTTPQA